MSKYCPIEIMLGLIFSDYLIVASTREHNDIVIFLGISHHVTTVDEHSRGNEHSWGFDLCEEYVYHFSRERVFLSRNQLTSLAVLIPR